MIKIFNRKTNKYEVEKVAGEKYIQWCYDSPIGKGLTELLIKKKLTSKIYGDYCDTKLSKKKIKSFINDFNINMSESIKSQQEFISFNDFFIRKLKENARPMDSTPSTLISPGDGRLFAYENISCKKLIQVKGIHYTLEELLENKEKADEYEGGVCLVLRLCPTDYHRFHFIDNGIPKENHTINGNYYSVNPTALERIPKLYCQNKREWSIFESENFGEILHIEVGATCVGTIVQTYEKDKFTKRGCEKGYFKFGGSTTILFFKENTVNICEEILVQTDLGFETKVSLGETIGTSK